MVPLLVVAVVRVVVIVVVIVVLVGVVVGLVVVAPVVCCLLGACLPRGVCVREVCCCCCCLVCGCVLLFIGVFGDVVVGCLLRVVVCVLVIAVIVV